MSDWQSYIALHPQHTVVGDLRIKKKVHSPQLDNERDVLVYLPPSYSEENKHYPVVYMQDGQNLFDHFSSFAGEWQIDETMTILAETGCEAIIVGLPNIGKERNKEYNPYPGNKPTSAKGDAYIRFIIETVKPLIDSEFRTLREAQYTGIAGSSMGGLISLYGFLQYQDVFGFCGAFSPSYWFASKGLQKTIAEKSRGQGRLYLDIGTAEGSNSLVMGIASLRDALLNRGYYLDDNLIYIEEEGANHSEQAWAKRFPGAIKYLLGY